MGTVKQHSTATIHHFIRKFFLAFLLVLAAFHFFCCTFREVMKDYGALPKVWEQWGFLFFLAAGLLYYFTTLLFFPDERKQIKSYLHSFISYEQLYLLALFVWAVLSCFFISRATGKNLYGINDNFLYEYAFIALVFFPMARYLGRGRAASVIMLVLKLVLLPSLALCAWMLWKYIHFENFVFPSGWSLSEGKPYAFTYGVNPNLTGSLTLTMFLLCLMFSVSEKAFRRCFYCIGAIVFAIALVLSNCRTAWYASLITLPVFVFLLVQKTFFAQKKGLRILVGLLCACVSVILFRQFRISIFNFVMQAREMAMVNSAQPMGFRIQNETSSARMMSQFTSSVLSQPSPLIRELASSSDHLRTYESGLTGRGPIYKASFVVMFSRKIIFLFGTTPGNVGNHLYGLCGVKKIYAHAHNLFLQTGVGLGVPAMLGMIVFTFSLFLRSLRLLVNGNNQAFSGSWCVPIVLFGLLAADMMESFLAASIWGPASTVFYLLAGWLTLENRDLNNRKHPSRQTSFF